MKRKVAIIGAGPAGLTAAYELLSRSPGEFSVTVFEESNAVGGISRTVVHNGNRMDMGGHRFFSKSQAVNEWWEKMLPTQGAPARDDKMLNRDASISAGGPDPEKSDNVMLRRHRLSRIFWDSKFFDYPISLKLATLKNMGIATTASVSTSYIRSQIHRLPETSLENFYINRFGRKLYSMFFEHYTENVWGRHPADISAEWGAQRAKGLSFAELVRNMLERAFGATGRKTETSLIEEFSYPKLGPGQLWELTASRIEEMGGTILMNSPVVGVTLDNVGYISSVTFKDNQGQQVVSPCDFAISSMPIKDLVSAMDDVPIDVATIASDLPYRDFMTVGVLLRHINLRNETDVPSINGILPDNWIYVHDRRVDMGRIQVFNNWSPYLVADNDNTVWLGLEYFCNEGDQLWSMDDLTFAAKAVVELAEIGFINGPEDVLDFHVERVKKAYPAYFDSYDHIDIVRDYLDTIPNLFCVGRNGQHRYNNLDHSMLTSFEAVSNIISGRVDKTNVWSVNTEQEYHEQDR